MLQKLFAISFAALSLVSCNDGPKVAVGISKPAIGGMVVIPAEGDDAKFVPYSETDKWVSFSPTDAKILLDYCGIKDKQQASTIVKHYAKKAARFQ